MSLNAFHAQPAALPLQHIALHESRRSSRCYVALRAELGRIAKASQAAQACMPCLSHVKSRPMTGRPILFSKGPRSSFPASEDGAGIGFVLSRKRLHMPNTSHYTTLEHWTCPRRCKKRELQEKQTRPGHGRWHSAAVGSPAPDPPSRP